MMMRLIKDDGHGHLSLVEYHDEKIPRYAILSHTWGEDGEEVTFKDLTEGTGGNKAGYNKIEFCRKQAVSDELQHFWVDTCCIDKSSSAELSEAINSMFRWYQSADKCYVYLLDVSSSGEANNGQLLPTRWEAAFRSSRWFTRGWTLQELLAPASVEFFSREGNRLGSKDSLKEEIYAITGISLEALRGGPLTNFEVEERFSWAKHRETKRQEDRAYSLLGIFNIHMSLRYGEGSEEAFVRLRRKIGKFLNPLVVQPEILSPPSSTVPFRRDIDFIDRIAPDKCGTLLEQIEQRCITPSARVALVGFGGAGKSQLAIEYCYRLREQSPNIWVFWIYASNANRVEQGYREIAERLKIPGRKDLKQNIFELVARWLRDESNGMWMLVLDNLDHDIVLSTPEIADLTVQSSDGAGQFQQPFSLYLPQSQNGVILITTRTKSVAMKLVELRDIIPVEPMIDRDATMLLKKKLDQPVDESVLKELANILEYMPLAIVQAAAYIRQKGTRYSVQQYIKAFQRNEKQKMSLLNHEAGYLQRDPEAKNSILITWQISFNDIREKWPLSADLLSLMSYFDRQGIPEEVLKAQPREEIWEPMKHRGDVLRDNEKEGEDITDSSASETDRNDIFEESMERLQSYSFVSIGEDGRTFKMHGLVQLAMRKWLKIHGEEEKWKAQFSRKLSAVFPSSNHKNWGWCEILFPHAKSAEKQRPADNRSVRDWAQVLRKAGLYTSAKGDYYEAERMCKKSAEAMKKILGEEHPDTLTGMNSLASTYWNQGRWPEAEQMFVQVMETRRRVLGEEHPDTLTSMANLASTYRNQGRWTEAEQIDVQVMETRRRVLGEEHPDTLTSMNNLASTYRNQGRWTEAEQIEVQVMETRRRVLGEEHPDTLTSMANLASTYWNQGRWTEAEQMFVQVMETTRRVLGEEHPDTLTYMANLASTYRNQGRWPEAEQMFVQVMETRRRVLGEEHPDTLTSMANLASTYWNQGRWPEAEQMFVQVMETRRRVLGEEHPDTLTSMANLASTYRNQGRWTEAEQIDVQVIETRRRVLGEEHPDTLTSMNNLASTYRNQGRWTEAEQIEVQVMETRRRVLGEEHPDTLTSMANLASTYWNQGRWTEAEQMFVQVMETTRRVLGEEHPDTLTYMANLASTYRNQGRWPEAEQMFVQVMETRRRVLGEEHPDTLTSMANLASTYRNQGRWTEAEQMFVQVMETTRRVLGEEHPDTLTSMANLASTYRNQGRWPEAEQMFVQVMETRRRVLGEEHPDTLTSMNNLASTYRNQGRWTEAEQIDVQVIETRRRVLGEEHPDTLTSMANLASTYRNQGRWTEAEQIDVQVIETRRRVLGEEHPDTLTSMANLASTYWNQGRWTEAEQMFVQVMETTRRVLGEEHPDTLTSMNNLASTYRNQGRWTEAEQMFVQVMETTRRVLGEEHPDTLTSMNNLASTYWNQGRWTEAEQMFVQVMETRRRVLGEEHPNTVSSMANLASTMKEQGRKVEAIKLMAECVQLSNRVLGPEHPQALSSNMALAKWQSVE